MSTEHFFTTHDGQALFYRHWQASSLRKRGAIVLLHRGHEHSGRMAHLVDELNLPDFEFFAWDARGHGRSPGPRGYSPSFSTSVRDLDGFVRHICQTHQLKMQDVHVIAQSVGAVLAATWMHDYAPQIRAATLASPAFKIKLYVPFAVPGLALLHALRGVFYVNSYVKPQFLTHDARRIASYRQDPSIARPIAVNVLLGLYQAAKRVVSDAQAVTRPVQLFISGQDWVVHEAPQIRFFAGLSNPIKSSTILPGFLHDTLGEQDRQPVVAQIRRFIQERFNEPAASEQPLLRADLYGETAQEAKQLAAPLPICSFGYWWWKCLKLNLRLGSWWSKGIALGQATGYDSGATLDYVYANQAQGRGLIGRCIDRVYLNSIGWRGIRQRKVHVEELLLLAARRLQAQGQECRLLDIACGHARYLIDAAQAFETPPASVLLRDYSQANLQAARHYAEVAGMGALCETELADAFRAEDLDALKPEHTLAIVSGLYELFSDNSAVLQSLRGVSQAMVSGGYLVLTNQPWHPQLELIARGLTSHRQGQAWVMRRRAQAEVDALARSVGLEKVEQRIDDWGIFTVCLYRKP